MRKVLARYPEVPRLNYVKEKLEASNMSSSVRYCAKCSYLFLKFILVIYATIFWVSLLLSIIFIAGYTLLPSDFTTVDTGVYQDSQVRM